MEISDTQRIKDTLYWIDAHLEELRKSLTTVQAYSQKRYLQGRIQSLENCKTWLNAPVKQGG